LHHVTVEVLALAQAGRDVNAVYTERAVNEADWKRTARVQVKEKAGAIELQFSTTESMDSILKAMPQSLAEEIVKVAENAETPAKDAGVDVATETVAEESAEDSTKRFVDLKQVDAAEKATMRAIKAAVKKSMSVITDDFLSTPVADPVLKLAVSVALTHISHELERGRH
jgi:fibronectin type 3 domain-containing protein